MMSSVRIGTTTTGEEETVSVLTEVPLDNASTGASTASHIRHGSLNRTPSDGDSPPSQVHRSPSVSSDPVVVDLEEGQRKPRRTRSDGSGAAHPGAFRYNSNDEIETNNEEDTTTKESVTEESATTISVRQVFPRRLAPREILSPDIATVAPRSHQSLALSQPVVATAVGDGDIVTAEQVERESFFQNKNRTRSLLVLLLALLCALAIGLGVSLSGSSSSSSSSAEEEEPNVFSQVTAPMDGPVGSEYGSSVSMCGDGSRVAIAGPGGTGLVQVFQLLENGGRVQLGQNLTLSSTAQQETSMYVRTRVVVDLSSDCNVLAIGEPYASIQPDQPAMGRVSLYEYINDVWEPLGTSNTITGLAANDYAGASVSLSHDGGLVAVGAPGHGGDHQGQVRMFLLNGPTWNQLGSSLTGIHAQQAFGGSVSLSSKNNVDVVAIGSSTGTGDNTATVKVFEFFTGDWKDRGSEIVADIASLEGIETTWMVQLSLDGKRLVISNLYLRNEITRNNKGLLIKAYEFNDEQKTWKQLGKNLHQDFPGAKSGYIISLSRDGTRMGMGDPGSERAGGLSGHAHFYELIDNTKWCQIGPNIEGDAAGDLAGFAISLSGDGNRLVIGSPFSRARGRTHGRVRVFDIVDMLGVEPNCDV